MPKIILLVLTVIILSTACAVQRPINSPYRPDDKIHRQAKTIKQCLECHPCHPPDDGGRVCRTSPNMGDCIKCHFILDEE
jgi:hypothetical protein